MLKVNELIEFLQEQDQSLAVLYEGKTFGLDEIEVHASYVDFQRKDEESEGIRDYKMGGRENG